ncbi:MAG: hypothetical protein DMG13_19370 [Acidobacteria bacterium]|nr:MAG: hypothetical protein DMG13_19370 [Acidobacteriota bacterium]
MSGEVSLGEGGENVWLHRFALLTACCTALLRPALAMLQLVVVQLLLGALTVWTSKAVVPATAHVATGALILGTSPLLTLRTYGMAAVRVPAWK